MDISAIQEVIDRRCKELMDGFADLKKEDEKRIQMGEDLIRQVKGLTDTIKSKFPDAEAVSQKA